jgi:hypothetical protein
LQIAESEAMYRLQQRSRQTRKLVGEVAAEVIAADTFFVSWEQDRKDTRSP